MDASRFKSLRTFDIEVPPAHACRCQNRAGAKLRAAIEVEGMETVGTVCGIDSVDNDRGHHSGAEFEHLQNSAGGEFVSRKTVRKTDEVLDSGRCARLPSGTETIQYDGRNALGRRVNSRCNSRGSCADDHEVDKV